ncbi:hypothetical protein K1719_030716 [Acacia pycnantha]|nr:hypothetical protein K1719_030716 [Acacia pycnantha]
MPQTLSVVATKYFKVCGLVMVNPYFWEKADWSGDFRYIDEGNGGQARYPDDSYGRLWRAEGGSESVKSEKNEAASIDASKAEDQPPLAVLQTAAISTSWGIDLNTGLSDTSQPIFIIAYFSEVTRLPSNETRSIKVEIDLVPYSQLSLLLSCIGAAHHKRDCEFKRTRVTASANESSTLPPLLNAYEVYTISGALTDGTNSDDVKGLEELKREFKVLRKSSGILEALAYQDHYQTCSMAELETIDMHNNSLSGPIPSVLGSLPKLSLVNLADNRFSGTIPKSLSQNKNLELIM